MVLTEMALTEIFKYLKNKKIAHERIMYCKTNNKKNNLKPPINL